MGNFRSKADEVVYNRSYYRKNAAQLRSGARCRAKASFDANPEVHRERTRRNRQNNPKAVLDSWLKSTYGIDLDTYERMLKEQDGKCAICKKEEIGKRRLSVDHDHVTQAVRGLLCSKCNFLLGQAGDSIEILLAAIEYLRLYSVA